MKPKNTICLWFNKDAHEAARFYAATFPDSRVTAVHQAPSDFPGGKKGDELTVEFTVLGIPCIGLNGGSQHGPDCGSTPENPAVCRRTGPNMSHVSRHVRKNERPPWRSCGASAG